MQAGQVYPSSGIPNSIIKDKGDLIAGQSEETPAILPVGNDGDILVVDSGELLGVKWEAPIANIPESVIAAKGDLIVGANDNTPNILSVGGNGKVLVADNAQTLGIRWGAPAQQTDPAATWTSGNPVLEDGEIGIESDTKRFKFGNGTTAWNSLSYVPGIAAKTVNFTTGTLNAGASEDFTISAGTQFQLLSVTASVPSWVRVYGTSAARANDTRSSPGGSVPNAGTEYYAELVTTSTPETIRLSPVPLVQTTGGNAFIRVRNETASPTTITLSFYVISLEG